ncbi:hypothetical protein TRVA0_001S01860 [Trichomonascus vanleenenianus]|uniref:uncharacterized protein n=1 Tax=Trichomonascus vanleenenianus TaxID=2268995 RepID=UPI003ECA0B16
MRISQYKSTPILSISFPLLPFTISFTKMAKDKKSKQTRPTNQNGENPITRVKVVSPSEFFAGMPNPLDELPEHVRRRYLEEAVGNDMGELLRLSTWALSHHPRLKPGVTLDVEEVPGQGLAVVANEAGQSRPVDQTQPAEETQPGDQANPEDEGKKKVVMALYDVRKWN